MIFENSTLYLQNTTSGNATDCREIPMVVPSTVLVALSIMGCIFNLFATFLFKHHKHVLGKMMIFFSINDLILMVLFGPSYLCWLGYFPYKYFIMRFTWIGSMLWACCFAHALYISVKFGEECLTNSLLKKYVCSSLILSAVFASLIQIFPIDAKTYFWSTKLFAVVIITCFLCCAVCYIAALKILRHHQGKIHLELLLYPLILLICELPLLTITANSLLTGKPQPSGLFYNMAEQFFLSRGIWNSLSYGLSSKIRNGFKILCRRENRQQQKRPSESQFSLITHTDFSGSQIRRVTTLKDPNFILKYSCINSQDSRVSLLTSI